MKLKSLLFMAVSALLAGVPAGAQPAGYPIGPVPFTSVKVAPDSFWGQRLKASREVTIPLAFSKCESEGRYENFVKAEKQMHSPVNLGYEVGGFSFDDTDVYKTIEGASYVLQTYPDRKLEAYIDSVLAIVAKAQEPDGYLYTARTMNPAHPHDWAGDKRWVNDEELSHELYNLGHMVEGAIAHWQATGKRNFLDIAIRYADCVVREVGAGSGQARVVPGHQIAEMALAKLYLATREQKYLDEAKFFLDERGKTGHNDPYNQTHIPVLEQDEAVGHAVRAAYMYAGLADVAALTGDRGYVDAIDRIWENIVSRKLYITGGIGATNRGEAFGAGYELPNETAYCETCAAIGNVYVNYRMFLLHGDAKYIDVLERTLYNGLLSGVSLDGGGFFYPNPLASHGQHRRQPWFGCACCPSNICRFIPSVPGYIYAVKDNALYVNLFVPNTMTQKVAGKNVTLTQKTGYPFDSDIEISIDKTALKKEMSLQIRIPGWVRGEAVPSDLYAFADNAKTGYTVTLNGERIQAIDLEAGYFTITRKWKKGDKVVVHFDMTPRLVKAHPEVKADAGRIAVQKGPVVYCAEWPDNPAGVHNVLVGTNPPLTVVPSDELGGIDKVTLPAQALSRDAAGRLAVQDVTLTLIPYYAWCHRGSGDMAVWLAQTLNNVQLRENQ